MTQYQIEAYDAMMADRDSWKERFHRLAKEKALGALRDSAIKNAEMAGDLASDLQRLRSAVRNLRDVQGRHHTQIATERLFALLPENDKGLATQPAPQMPEKHK